MRHEVLTAASRFISRHALDRSFYVYDLGRLDAAMAAWSGIPLRR